jgi:TonB family protein
MTTAAVSFRAPVLPWAVAPEDEARFKRIFSRVLMLCLAICIVFPFMPRPQENRAAAPDLPPRVAKLLMEPRAIVPPPPPAVTKPDRALPQADSKVDKPQAKPEPKAPVPEARNPQPNKPPGEALDNARKKASGVGLLAMKDQLSELTGAPLAVQLKADIKPGAGVGTGSGPGVGAGNEAGLPVRSMITSNATGGSGGINTAAYSRNTGGGGLAGRATTLVEGVAGGGGGGGFGGGGVAGSKGNGSGMAGGGTLQRSGSGKASRSIEEIKLVFERNKGAIYAIYNRALRDDPSLQGKVVVKLTISPAGNVVDVRVESSELKASELEAKLLARIRSFDFGAKEVDQMVVTWPVDFLPS